MIVVYVTSVSGSLEIKKKQTRIEMVLQGKKIPFQIRDIATNEQYRNFMKAKSGQTMPPQIFQDEDYLGDFDQFENAVEMDELNQFLRL